MNKGFYHSLLKVNEYLNKVLVNIQVAAIVIAALVVTLDVFLRAAFSRPISGASEYVGYIMIIASYFGLGICAAERSHLKVDLLVQMFSPKAQIINDLINAVLVAAVGGIMLYASVNQTIITFDLGTRGTFSGVYNWPFYLLMGIAYIPVIIASINNFIGDIFELKSLKAGKPVDKGDSEI